jgi:hypothetical protein
MEDRVTLILLVLCLARFIHEEDQNRKIIGGRLGPSGFLAGGAAISVPGNARGGGAGASKRTSISIGSRFRSFETDFLRGSLLGFGIESLVLT